MVKTLSGVTNQTISDTLRVNKLRANNSLGTSDQILKTTGSSIYWSNNDSTPTNTFTIGTSTYFVANGNVGIGNTAPAHKLSVNGSILVSNSSSFIGVGSSNHGAISNRKLSLDDGTDIVVAGTWFGSNGFRYNTSNGHEFRIGTGSIFSIGSSGVGVGTTAPTANFTIANGTTATTSHIYGTYTDTSNYERLNLSANSTGNWLVSEAAGTGTARPLNLGANNTTYVVVAANGNVGVGNSAPDATLAVTGTANISGNVVIGGNLSVANITATSFSGNGANITSVNAATVGGNTASDLRDFSSNATNLSSGTVAEARLPYRMNQNVRTSDNVSFNDMILTGNLVISGGVTVATGNTVTFTDNMLYLNQGVEANVTNVSGNGSYIVFTANNNYSAGWDVEVSGVNPSSFNGTYNNIFAANSTTFTVANTNANTYVSGGLARGKSDLNPDIGIAAGHNDGTYHHTGIFRDASDGYWKVFDGYDPEPDASIFIDTSNTSFNIANFWANDIRLGNTSVYATINSTSYSGGANSAIYANGSITNTFTVGNSVYFVANGNVGIGNTTPPTKLHLYANDTSFNRVYVQQDGNGRAGLRLKTSASDWIMETVTGFDGGALLLFDNSPSGASNYVFKFFKSGILVPNGSFGTPAYSFIDDPNTGLFNPSNDTIGFSTGGSEKVRINSSGNVGIGNSTPDAKLTVTGTANISGNVVIGGTLNSGSLTAANLTSTTDIISFGNNYNSGTKALKFQRAENKAAIWSVPVGSYGRADLRFTTGDNTEATAKTEANATVRIAPAGGVVIGNAYLAQNPADGVLITSSDVGIGITTLTARLTIANGTSSTSQHIYGTFTDVSNYERLNLSANSTAAYVLAEEAGSGTARPLNLGANNTTHMVIAANGNVGVGTTGPSFKLVTNETVAGNQVRNVIIHGDNTNVGSHSILQIQTGGASGGDPHIFFGISGVGSSGWNLGLDNSDSDKFKISGPYGDVGGLGLADKFVIDASGNVGIGTSTPGYKLEVSGSFAATTKSFVIKHPTKKGKKLRYGSLEGPENGVYVRGRITDSNTIELPDYWHKLVDKDSITVSLTPIGKTQQPSVNKVTAKKITLIGENIDCFYHVFAERKDVEKLITEIDE